MRTLAMMILLLGAPYAAGQTLLVDEFNGARGGANAHPGGVVDVTTYRVPFGGEDFVGRTNFRFTLPQDNVTTTATGSTDGKVAVLNLDTFNPSAPGDTFLGTDVLTKRNFAVGGGLRMTSRMRVAGPIPGGLVAAAFLYDVQRESAPGVLVRDEIDHEILTNAAQTAGPDNTLTNVWNDGDFSGGGTPVTISNPTGFDVTQFHDYTTEWTPTSVKWYINNTLVRTENTVVPDDPMKAHFNFWAPDSTFTDAFNSGLTPTATGPGTTYRMEVDRLQIDRFNTTVSSNLLADTSFENITAPALNGTGGWTIFNNAFNESAGMTDPVIAQDGVRALKAFGPFPNGASGAFQNVPASAGQQFEGSVWAYSPSGDSILGQENYTNVTLQFLNSAGSVLGSVNFSPGTNQKDTPIFDGRDPNMVQDQWIQYTVNAVAPANTAFVRQSLFFIQLNNQGGAAWFDNASLVRLTAAAAPVVTGDYNNNGTVDAADYTLWRDGGPLQNEGVTIGFNTPEDFTFWKSRFGATSSSAALSSAAVPEPATLTVSILVALGVGAAARNRRT